MGQAPAAADTLLKGKGLPDYQAITPEAVSQGMPWLLEQLEAQPEASPTAPGDAHLQQESPVEQQELEVETAPRAALSSFFLLWSQAARTLRRAAAARVVRVRVMT